MNCFRAFRCICGRAVGLGNTIIHFHSCNNYLRRIRFRGLVYYHELMATYLSYTTSHLSKNGLPWSWALVRVKTPAPNFRVPIA